MLPDIASQAREQESQAGSPNTSHSSVRHVVVERLQNLLVTVLVISYSSEFVSLDKLSLLGQLVQTQKHHGSIFFLILNPYFLLLHFCASILFKLKSKFPFLKN